MTLILAARLTELTKMLWPGKAAGLWRKLDNLSQFAHIVSPHRAISLYYRRMQAISLP
jgi:hypothetical protein